MKTKDISIASFTEDLNRRLKEFKTAEAEPFLSQTGKFLSFTRSLLQEMKEFTVAYHFENVHEEILFFKHQKPVLLSQFYYYKQKMAIQLFDAFRDKKSRMENYHHKLQKIQSFIHKHKDFYEYCMAGSSYLDEAYFTRYKKQMMKINFDENFTTGYDKMLSKILAIEMMRTYLFDLIEELKGNRMDSTKPSLTWTGPKIELVELIYALQAVGSFNNASTDVRKIVEAFEMFFNIDLGNYYRTFVGLRMRKNGYTSFLDRMKEKLEQRINEIEER